MNEPPAGRGVPAVTLGSTSDSIEKAILLAAVTVMAALTPLIMQAWPQAARIFPGSRAALAGYVATVAFVLPVLFFRASRLGVCLDGHGATVRRFWYTKRHGWPEVSRLADGGTRRRGVHYWALVIVLRSGRTVTVNGPARGHADAAALSAIGRVAAHYQIPAELDGIPRWRGQQVPDPPAPRLETEQDWQVIAARATRAKTRHLVWLTAAWSVFAAGLALFVWAASHPIHHHKNPWLLLAYAAVYFWGAGLRLARDAKDEYKKLETIGQVGRAQAGLGVQLAPVSRRATVVLAGVGIAAVAAIVAGVGFAAFTALTTHSNGTAGTVQVTWDQLQAGDCLRGSDLGLGTSKPWPQEFTAVPCQQQHIAEVIFAGEAWPISQAYPGDDAIDGQADHRCDRELAVYVGGNQRYLEAFTFQTIRPDRDDWAGGDRSLRCIAYEATGQYPGGAPVSYSIKSGGH